MPTFKAAWNDAGEIANFNTDVVVRSCFLLLEEEGLGNVLKFVLLCLLRAEAGDEAARKNPKARENLRCVPWKI